MNGPEGVDSPIVAVKPANEAARAAAEEPVEPRGGTKENAGPANHGPDAEPGSPCHMRRLAYEKP